MAGDYTFFDKDTSFRGSISTPHELVVEGSVTGEVEAVRQVTLLNGASVEGPIRTTRILLEEGAYHLGVLSLSRFERPDSISLADLERLRNPSQPTTAGLNGHGNGTADPAGPEPENREEPVIKGLPAKEDRDAPTRRDSAGEVPGEEPGEDGQEESPSNKMPVGFPEDPEDFDRLW